MGKYEAIYLPNHPKAKRSGGNRVYSHVVVAEKILGRYLTTENVHHIDGNKFNNTESNIMIFKTNRDHLLFHGGAEIILYEPNIYIAIPPPKSFCSTCGGDISSKQANQCMKCASKDRIKFNPSKEELETLTNTMSFVDIAKKYNISVMTIWRKCKELEISYTSHRQITSHS
jgi:hypothetical protein